MPLGVAGSGSVQLSKALARVAAGMKGQIDEQPIFSAANIDGPATLPVQVKVTDRAGRTAAAQAEAHVLDVSPTVVINGAPATVSEGTEIDLTSAVTPGEASDFTYAWSAAQSGTVFATGSSATFSFTPVDNGAYVVSLKVTDQDGGEGTASQTIDASNVAPALGNMQYSPAAHDEGGSITVSGSITDPGTKDSLTLSINWGDGSAEEIQSLSAGTTSFTVSHTYADDDPTATASDLVNITVNVTD